MKKLVLSLSLIIMGIGIAKSQVNVGSSTAPQTGAALQITSAGKNGILGPKVALTSLVVYAPVDGAATDGMLVFHDGSNSIPAGYYFWSQNKWNSGFAGGGSGSGGGSFISNATGNINLAVGQSAMYTGYITNNPSTSLVSSGSVVPITLSGLVTLNAFSSGGGELFTAALTNQTASAVPYAFSSWATSGYTDQGRGLAGYAPSGTGAPAGFSLPAGKSAALDADGTQYSNHNQATTEVEKTILTFKNGSTWETYKIDTWGNCSSTSSTYTPTNSLSAYLQINYLVTRIQ